MYGKKKERFRYKGIQDVRKEKEGSDRGGVKTIRPPMKDCTNLNKGTDPNYGVKANKSTNRQWKKMLDWLERCYVTMISKRIGDRLWTT